VSALVDGSHPSAYKVVIEVPMFSIPQLAAIKDIVNSSPLILSSLVKKKLPRQILDKLQQRDIQLFPTQWSELSAFCDCPDWAMPCKHLAALVYVISDEIDKNPFTLFNLRGCNLLDMVDDFKDGSLEQRQQVPKIGDVVMAPLLEFNAQQPSPSPPDPARLDAINFAKIDNILARTMQIISCEPPIFYEKDFLKILESCYKHWSTHAKIVDSIKPRPKLSDEDVFLEHWGDPSQIGNFSVDLGDTHGILKIYAGTLFNKGESLQALASFFSRMPNSYLHKVCYNLRFMHTIFVFASRLVEKSAIIPQVLQNDSGETFIRWIPALCDTNVMHTCAQLAEMCPVDAITFRDAPLPPIQQVISAAALFIAAYIQDKLPTGLAAHEKNKIVQLFFANTLIPRSSKIAEREIPSSINNWLSRLFLWDKRHKLYLLVNATPSADTPAQDPFSILSASETEPDSLPSTSDAEPDSLPSTSDIPTPDSLLSDTISASDTPEPDSSITPSASNPPLKDAFGLNVLVAVDDVPVPLATAFKSKEARLSLLSDAGLLFEYIPELESTVDSNEDVIFSTNDFAKIFMQVLPILKSMGVEVILPKSLRNILRPRFMLNVKTKDSKSSIKSLVNVTSMLNFDWRIAIGSNDMSIEDFVALVDKAHGLVRIRDEYVVLDEKEMLQLLSKIDKLPSRMDHADFMQAALAGEIDGASVMLDSKLESLLLPLTQVKPTPLPANLCATMRPYQERGFHWLMQNINLGFGSILADDMGLGKTLQVVAVILALKNEGAIANGEKVLIVVPTSLLSNWQKEFEKFAPSVRLFIYHGQNRKDDPIPDDIDVLITSYGLARRDMKELNKRHWFLIVIDEAQNIKNSDTAQSKAVKGINAAHKIAMSGTPVENRLLEYWNIFDFTNENYLGSQRSFVQRYASPIERSHDAHSLELFKKVTAPFILRRLKSDKSIISDLPEKIENNRYCSLTAQQAALYQGVVENALDKIDESSGIARRGLILSMINALKQICNHPSQYTKVGVPSIAQSGKTELLEEILREIDETSSEKVIIFTQYTKMGDILVRLLEESFHARVPFLHGGLSCGARDQIVDDFQTKFNTRILLVSLKAGGTGLNLTAANHVIHYDLWWNPAVETQATDRAYRIGQKQNVMVHRFLTKGTFEEQIDEMISRKKDLANLTVASGEAFVTDMTTAELQDLVALRKS
jgi:SNF2 family DNA or RNA helicase/uncharacterized Zn finger protein